MNPTCSYKDRTSIFLNVDDPEAKAEGQESSIFFALLGLKRFSALALAIESPAWRELLTWDLSSAFLRLAKFSSCRLTLGGVASPAWPWRSFLRVCSVFELHVVLCIKCAINIFGAKILEISGHPACEALKSKATETTCPRCKNGMVEPGSDEGLGVVMWRGAKACVGQPKSNGFQGISGNLPCLARSSLVAWKIFSRNESWGLELSQHQLSKPSH